MARLGLTHTNFSIGLVCYPAGCSVATCMSLQVIVSWKISSCGGPFPELLGFKI